MTPPSGIRVVTGEKVDVLYTDGGRKFKRKAKERANLSDNQPGTGTGYIRDAMRHGVPNITCDCGHSGLCNCPTGAIAGASLALSRKKEAGFFGL
jgi:hypothetical protein